MNTSNYVLWFGAGIGYAIVAGLVAHFFAVYVFSKYPLVEEDPSINLDLLEAELLMEFAPVRAGK